MVFYGWMACIVRKSIEIILEAVIQYKVRFLAFNSKQVDNMLVYVCYVSRQCRLSNCITQPSVDTFNKTISLQGICSILVVQ